ncbi:hypothetical protein niasHT_020550 [Heterodera trifolii]|uniref:Uncharacterized protein n=1 Tax=Heterodera trifolii TaxID=157864 RepID=A0ABD2J9Q0_9BILA
MNWPYAIVFPSLAQSLLNAPNENDGQKEAEERSKEAEFGKGRRGREWSSHQQIIIASVTDDSPPPPFPFSSLPLPFSSVLSSSSSSSSPFAKYGSNPLPNFSTSAAPPLSSFPSALHFSLFIPKPHPPEGTNSG